MSEVMSEFPERRNGQQTWGYRQFLDGKVYRVRGGVDVAPRLVSAQAQLYATARLMGVRARIHIESKDPVVLIVQALPKAD